MTKEQRELLLKDICTRLPYEVKVQLYNYEGDTKTVETLREIDSDCYISTLECDTLKNIFKPYLFPLSSMTEEQKEEFDSILSSIGLCYAYDANNDMIIFSDSKYDKNNYISDFDKIEVWLNKNHFDYRGLIPMGLAKNATNLNIY